MPIKYTNVSLDPQLVVDLQKVHKRCLEPLGLAYKAPAVIRHLVKYHGMSNKIHSEIVHESITMKDEAENE